MSGASNLSNLGLTKGVRGLLVTPRGVVAPMDLVEGLRRRGVELLHASDSTSALSQLRERSPSIMVIVEPSKLSDSDRLASASQTRFPQVRVWSYLVDDADPLRPYVAASPRGHDPLTVAESHVPNAPWHESVPITVDEMSTLLGEDVPIIKPDIGDAELAGRLIDGHGSFTDAAMDLLRRRTGLADLRLAGVEAPGVEVAHEGHAYGRLTSAQADAGELRSAAAWLAPWLALERRLGELSDMAHRDELTGVWNRRYFERALALILDEAQRQKLRVTLMLYDIDDFKAYNDRHGHHAGDEILRETARLMRTVVRKQDVVARIGGDEFAVIFWDAEPPRRAHSEHPRTVRAVAERFQKAVAEHKFPKLGRDAPGRLTISGGLAGFPVDGRNAHDLIEQADQMMLQSKANGKNELTFGPGAAPQEERLPPPKIQAR